MIRATIAAVLLLGAGSIVGVPAGSDANAIHVVGKALDSASTNRADAAQAVDEATAVALIGAISAQFDQRPVEVELGRIDAAPAGFVQRELSGSGRLRIGSDAAWLPFRFHALYDTEQASVDSPRLTVGADGPGALLARRSPAVRELRSELSRRLRQEFAQQATRLALDAVRSVPTGGHYLQLRARGTASFGREGQAGADIRALYDMRSGDLLQLDYQLTDRG